MTWVWSALIAGALIGVCVGLSFTPEWAEAAVFASFIFAVVMVVVHEVVFT